MVTVAARILLEDDRDNKLQRAIGEEAALAGPDANNYEAFYNQGHLYRVMAQRNRDIAVYNEAVASFDAALALKPDDYRTLAELSSTLVELWRQAGDATLLEKARCVMERQLQSHPEDAYLAACISSRLGDEAKCREYLPKARELGALPRSDILAGECDLEDMRGKEWFIILAS